MLTYLKRVAVRKKGMEALQAVLIVVVGFFIISQLKSLGQGSVQGAGQQGQSIFQSIGGALGSAAGGLLGGVGSVLGL